jgi:hypothetical protein
VFVLYKGRILVSPGEDSFMIGILSRMFWNPRSHSPLSFFFYRSQSLGWTHKGK